MHPPLVEVVVSVRVEVDRLSHKDIRQRRRAIRHLFELDDPFALSGFLPFLDSDDQWFVEQSIEAIRRWDSGKNSKLIERISNHDSKKIRLLSLEVCVRYENSIEILSKLRADSDSDVSKRAWLISLKQYPDSLFQELANDGMTSNFVNIRRTTIESAIKRGMEKIILQGMNDEAPIVVSKSIEGMAKESIIFENLRALLDHPSALVRSTAYRRLNQENELQSDDTRKLLSNPNGEAIEAVIKAYSAGIEWTNQDLLDFLTLIPSDSLLPRLIRNSPSDEIDSVRARLLLGSCPEIRKMRYLEDLIGRNIGPETLISVKKITQEEDEGPVRAMAIEVLQDRETLGKTEGKV